MLAARICSEFEHTYLKYQRLKTTQTIDIAGLNILVFRDVFSPDPAGGYASSQMLAALSDLNNKRVLDLGTGCGLYAVYAALQGAAQVVAVDNNHLAVINALENVDRYQVGAGVDVRGGHLFSVLGAQDQPFDLILVHLPVLVEELLGSEKLLNLYHRVTLDAAFHLASKGRMLISYPSFGDPQVLYFLEHHPLKKSVAVATYLGADWYLFEFQMAKSAGRAAESS